MSDYPAHVQLLLDIKPIIDWLSLFLFVALGATLLNILVTTVGSLFTLRNRRTRRKSEELNRVSNLTTAPLRHNVWRRS